MKLQLFLKECNEKNVFKKLSIYIVPSWILIQVLAIVWQPLGFPKESITFLIIILLIGFPVNVYLVWRFHLLPLENEIAQLDENGDPIPKKYLKKSFQKMYFSALSIISIVSVVIILLIINNNFKPTLNLKKVELSDKIAVLKFGNDTGDKKYDVVGKMAADWIIHGITENEVGQVISSEIVESYTNNINTSAVSATNAEKLVKDYFKPGKIITGNFYLKNDKLLFQSSITDGELNESLKSFKLVECNSDNPLDCIETLKQVILGYLITEENKLLNLQEEFPPKFEAYKFLFDAKANVSNNAVYLDFLNKSIAADPNYFEPKVLRVAYYYNNAEFKKADSLRKEIIPTSSGNLRQRNLLNLYDVLLIGNNNKVYSFLKKEYNIVPFDLATNSSAMVIALQYVNKPQDVDAIFNVTNP